MDIFGRMLAGGTIRMDDPELPAMWAVVSRALRLSPVLNAATDTSQVRALLSELTGRPIDASTTVFAPFHTNFGRHIVIGKNVFINHACTMLDLGGITIEDDVQLGPKVNLITENHPTDPAQRKTLLLSGVLISVTPGLEPRPPSCPALRWAKTPWWRRAPWCTKTWQPTLSWAVFRPE